MLPEFLILKEFVLYVADGGYRNKILKLLLNPKSYYINH